MEKVDVAKLKNVSETLLIPLYFKAKETQHDALICDKEAVRIVHQLNYDFSQIDKDWKTHIYTVVRTEILDSILTELSKNNKKITIVNLGAGLDTRHSRFPQFKWYQLDLSEPIKLRRTFFENSSEIIIEKSVLDFSWIHDIVEKENLMFIAEGLLFYLREDEVKSIFKNIANHFSNSYIAFDTVPKPFLKKKKHDSVKIDEAPSKWGNHHLKEIEDWGYGMTSEKVFYILSKHKLRWKGLSLLNLFPNFKGGFKVALMRIK